MKTALLLKRIDVLVQFAALFIPILLTLVKNEPGYLLLIYLTVGGVQVVSCIINKATLDPFYKSVGRQYYEIVLLLLVIMTALDYVVADGKSGLGVIWYFCMLFIGIVMAVWYGVLTFCELDKLHMQVDRKQYI